MGFFESIGGALNPNNPPKSEAQKLAKQETKTAKAEVKSAAKEHKAVKKSYEKAVKNETKGKGSAEQVSSAQSLYKTSGQNMIAKTGASNMANVNFTSAKTSDYTAWSDKNPGSANIRSGAQQGVGYACAGAGAVGGGVGGFFVGGPVGAVVGGSAGLSAGSAIGARLSPEGSKAREILSATTAIGATVAGGTLGTIIPGVGPVRGAGIGMAMGSSAGNATAQQGGFVNKSLTNTTALGVGLALPGGIVKTALATAGTRAALYGAGSLADRSKKVSENYGEKPNAIVSTLANNNSTDIGMASAVNYADSKFEQGQRFDLGSATASTIGSTAHELIKLPGNLLNMPKDLVRNIAVYGGGGLAALYAGKKVTDKLTQKKEDTNQPAPQQQPQQQPPNEMVELMRMQMMMNMQQQSQQPPSMSAEEYSKSQQFTQDVKKK